MSPDLDGPFIVTPHWKRWAVWHIGDDMLHSTWDTQQQAELARDKANRRYAKKWTPRR